MARLLLWVVIAVLAILVAGALWLMFAPAGSGTHPVEKVVPVAKLPR